jgi:DNA-binding GntR family transcriptional regulator
MSDYLYEIVADAIREKIITGEWEPGRSLPTYDELEERYNVSRVVVRKVMDLLAAEGLITRTARSGTYVRRYSPVVRRSGLHYQESPAAPFAEEALAAEYIPSYDHDSYEDQATEDIARRLNIAVGDPVMRTDYVSKVNDKPVMLVYSHEPLAITRGTPIEFPERGPFMGQGLVVRFGEIGLRPTSVTERTRSRMPRPSEVQGMRLEPGTPVVLKERTTRRADQVLEIADLIFDASFFEFEDLFPIPPA